MKRILYRNMYGISALGAAWLARLGAGIFTSLNYPEADRPAKISGAPPRNNPEIKDRCKGWKRAVGRQG